MKVVPDFEAFRATYEAGRPQVVYTTLVADLETPVSAYLKLADGQANAFLFESVEGGATIGRYSFITIKPDLVWRCRGGRAEINRQARQRRGDFEPLDGAPLETLRTLIAESRVELPAGLPPMAASLIGYMGYDMVRFMERLPTASPDVLGVPDSVFVRPTITAIFDRVEDLITLVTPVRPREGQSAAVAYDLACTELAEALGDFERSLPQRRERLDSAGTLPPPTSNVTPERFEEMVRAAVDYIHAGDAFQIVLSQRFTLPFSLPAFSLYRALRRLNPSPFLFYLAFEDYALVGSSPEVLVRLRDGVVTIRPLAGTRRRGADQEQDLALEKELLADPKECAEHLMLLDLGRNDVGRVARIGTVRVAQQFAVERYSHVMHISSTVLGDIDPTHDQLDALIAGFPAGTVSGAPKVRAMEIIEELEPDRRGTYGGAVGYFGADGALDTCIGLRTALVKDGQLHVQAGAGGVADSDPRAENEECANKARALIRAAEEAVRFARGGN